MSKTPRNKPSGKFRRNLRFSEVWLLIFALIFGVIGSYGWLRSFAAPEDDSILLKSSIYAEESAWFSSISGAALIILATGPIAAFILWWIWRRSAMELWAKLSLTVVPIMLVVTFT